MPSRAREIAAAAAALYVGAALFFVGATRFGGDLEGSWVWAINTIPGSPHHYGRDLVFSHGPLGWLLLPVDLGSHLAGAFAASAALSGLLAVALWRCLRGAPPAAAAIAVAALLVGSSFQGTTEYRAYLTAAAIACWFVASGSMAASLILGAFAGSLVFVKVSLGASAAAMLAGALAARYVGRSGRPPAKALAGPVAFGATVLGLSPALLGSAANLPAFLRGTAETGRGFVSAMSLLGPQAQVALAAGCLAIVVALVIALLRIGEDRPARASAALLPALAFAVRHGFVRQDDHVLAFFAAVIFTAGMAVATAASLRGALIAGGAAAGCAMVAWGATAPYGQWLPAEVVPLITLARARGELAAARDLPGLRAGLARASDEALRGEGLPAAWVEPLREARGTADAIPPEFGPFMRGEVAWMPSPTIQSHCAYTADLDRWQAEHFRGVRAPDFLIVRMWSIDSRHPLLDMPQAWQAIRERYQVAAREPGGRRLLLRKRPSPHVVELTARPPSFVPVGRVTAVPPGGVLLSLRLRRSWRGRLQEIFWRTGPVFVRLEYADGKTGYARLIGDVAAGGLSLGALPRDAGELDRWMRWEPAGAVKSFYLSGPGLTAYDEVAAVQWMARASTDR